MTVTKAEMTLIEKLRCAAQAHPLDAPMELFDLAADEIKRLENDIEKLKPSGKGSHHSCDIEGCAVCDPCYGL